MFIMRKKRLLFFFLLFIGYFVGYDTVVSAQNVPVEGDKYILLTADKSFKEQIEGINADTYIEIRNDFDLGGETVKVPEGCVLNFRGGSIGNGELLFSKTASYNYNSPCIQAGPYPIFRDNLIITGEFTSDKVSIEWFGAVGDGVTDCTDAFRRALKLCAGKYVRTNKEGQDSIIEYGKGYTIHLNNNRLYLVNGPINYYDGSYHDVKNVAFVGQKATQSESYPAYGNKPDGIFLKKPDVSLFAHADITGLKLENISITGEWIDWVKAKVKIFDDCYIRGLLLKDSYIAYIYALFYETGVWGVSRIHDNRFIGVYNFSYISKAQGKKIHLVDSSIYNNYINGGAPITKDSSGNYRCPVIDNSFFSWKSCNGSEISHNFIDYYATVYNCDLTFGNINSNHNHYQVFKYFHKKVNLYSFNDYFNWNDAGKDAIKDVVKRFASETYLGKDGKTYNVPSYIASDRYYDRNIVIKDAIIEENIKNIIFRTGIGDGMNNPGKSFIVSLHDRSVSRSNAIVYKEGTDYPVYLPVSVKYNLYIDKKLAHIYREIPTNLHFQGYGKIGIGEFVWVGNTLYSMCYNIKENGISNYELIKTVLFE